MAIWSASSARKSKNPEVTQADFNDSEANHHHAPSVIGPSHGINDVPSGPKLRTPSEKLTIHQFFYVAVMHGVCAMIISGVISFALAYGKSTRHSSLLPYPWPFPHTRNRSPPSRHKRQVPGWWDVGRNTSVADRVL